MLFLSSIFVIHFTTVCNLVFEWFNIRLASITKQLTWLIGAHSVSSFPFSVGYGCMYAYYGNESFVLFIRLIERVEQKKILKIRFAFWQWCIWMWILLVVEIINFPMNIANMLLQSVHLTFIFSWKLIFSKKAKKKEGII